MNFVHSKRLLVLLEKVLQNLNSERFRRIERLFLRANFDRRHIHEFSYISHLFYLIYFLVKHISNIQFLYAWRSYLLTHMDLICCYLTGKEWPSERFRRIERLFLRANIDRRHIHEFSYISHLFYFIYFLVKHISNIQFLYAWRSYLLTHMDLICCYLTGKEWPSTHAHTYENKHTHTKSRNKEKKKRKERG